MKRWIYVIAGIVALFFTGAMYAWSTLSQAIVAEFPHWSQSQLSMVFTVVIIAFCLSGLVNGIVMRKGSNPKMNIVVAAVLMLIGFWLASKSNSPIQLTLSFGLIVGIGTGVGYNTMLSTISKWFPNQQGLISGILLMGFGLGSFFIGKLYQTIVFTLPNTWRTAFVLLGICICAVLLLSLFFVKKPGAGDLPNTVQEKVDGASMGPGQMLRHSGFYICYLWAVLLSAAGLMLLSQGSGIVVEISSAVDSGIVAIVVGLFSVCNGVSRIAYGQLYDRKGYRFVMVLAVFLLAVSAISLMVAIRYQVFILAVAGFLLGGFSYGAVPLVSSALVAEFYGQKYYSVNFPLMGSSLFFSSFGSVVAGTLYDMSQSYSSSILVILVLAVVSFVLSCFLRRPAK